MLADTKEEHSSKKEAVQVGISVYKQQYRYIRECVESVLSQTLKQIVIDIRLDGPDSCDSRTLEWLRKIESKTNNLTIHQGRKHLGIYRSYNKIFGYRKTPFLCQVDADDYIDRFSLEILHERLIRQSDCAFAYSQCVEVSPVGKPMYIRHHTHGQNDLLTQFFTFHLRLIRRCSFDAASGYSSKYNLAADYDLCLRLNELGGFVGVELPLYFHRNHSGSESVKHHASINSESIAIVNKALERRCLSDQVLAVQGDEAGSIELVSINKRQERDQPFYIIPHERHSDYRSIISDSAP